MQKYHIHNGEKLNCTSQYSPKNNISENFMVSWVRTSNSKYRRKLQSSTTTV